MYAAVKVEPWAVAALTHDPTPTHYNMQLAPVESPDDEDEKLPFGFGQPS